MPSIIKREDHNRRLAFSLKWYLSFSEWINIVSLIVLNKIFSQKAVECSWIKKQVTEVAKLKSQSMKRMSQLRKITTRFFLCHIQAHYQVSRLWILCLHNALCTPQGNLFFFANSYSYQLFHLLKVVLLCSSLNRSWAFYQFCFTWELKSGHHRYKNHGQSPKEIRN